MAVRAADRVTLATLPAPTAVRLYYLLQDSTLTPPVKPTVHPPAAPWTITEPGYTAGSTSTLYTVMVTMYGTAWEYGDVQKSSSYEAAKQAGNAAANAVTVANLASAAAAGVVKAQQADPGHQAGRIWLQLDGSGRTIGIKISNGTAWASYALMADQLLVPGSVGAVQIKDGAITTPKLLAGSIDVDRLNAATFRGSTIEGATIISSATTGAPDNVTITNQAVTVNRDDGEGGSEATVTLGGSASDRLVLRPVGGAPNVWLDSDTGSGGVAGQWSVGDLLVDGDPLAEILDRRPRGQVCHWREYSNSGTITNTETALLAMAFPCEAGRVYRFRFTSYLAGTAGKGIQLRLRQRPTSGITVANGTLLQSRTMFLPTQAMVEFDWIADGTYPECHFLLSGLNLTDATTWYIQAAGQSQAQATIDDLGRPGWWSSTLWPTAGGGGTNPTPTTVTKTYDATWMRSWRGSGTVTDYLHWGYNGGLQRYSMVGFGGTLAADLAGATITKVEAKLTVLHTWAGAGGPVLVGSATNTTAPASPVTTGTTASTHVRAGQTIWVPVGGFSAASRAITLGVGAGTTAANYGKGQYSGVQLRISYSK